jgi:hypothetical protein
VSRQRVAHGRRLASAGLLLAGLAVVAGSFLPWAIYNSPLQSLYGRSGIDLGPGVATLGLGFFLVVIGGDALRRGGTSPAWSVALGAALLTLVPVLLFVLRLFIGSNYRAPVDFLFGVIGDGVYVVIVAAVIATVASTRLRMAGRVGGASS